MICRHNVGTILPSVCWRCLQSFSIQLTYYYGILIRCVGSKADFSVDTSDQVLRVNTKPCAPILREKKRLIDQHCALKTKPLNLAQGNHPRFQNQHLKGSTKGLMNMAK